MSNRLSYTFAICLLLLAAGLRLSQIATLPPGFSASEITDIRIAETVRQGRVEVFYNVHGQGREGLYQTLLTAVSSPGGGLIGYRILSVWLGMLTLALIYALGSRLFGNLAGLSALALMSVTMLPIILSRMVAPELILPLFVTAVLLALALSLPVFSAAPQRGAEEDDSTSAPKTAAFGALGLLLGLGFYLHPISFPVALLSMTFIVYMIVTRRPFTRRTLSFTWFAVVVMIVIATPYVISSLQRPMLAAAGRLFADDPNRNLLQTLAAGFNGLFFVGDSNPALNLPGRPLIDLVSGVILIVGVVSALRCWRQARCVLLLIALVFIAPFALLAAGSPNFLAYAPLLPLIALFFGLGVTTLYSSVRGASRIVAVVGLIALLAFNVVWVVRDLFVNWAQQPQMQQVYNARLGELAHYLDLTTADTPAVLCTATLKPQNNPVSLTTTQMLALMMHRQDVTLRYADCGSALILTEGGSREQVVLTEPDDAAGVNPYLQPWLNQGQIVNQPDLPADSVIVLDVTDSLAQRVGSFMTTAPVAFETAPTEGDNTAAAPTLAAPPIRFGGNITFLGYDHDWAATYAPGDVVPVVTYWRVDGYVPPDLRLFTHILSDPTNPVAQSHPISVLPSQLRPRDVFIQVTYVELPHTMIPGSYSISIGAYEDSTDIRLPVFLGDQPHGTRLFLGQIEVQGK